MLQKYQIVSPQGLRAIIDQELRSDELRSIQALIEYAECPPDQYQRIRQRAESLIKTVRQARKKSIGVDSFLNTYSLSTQEGIALMCLAEALLRIPDTYTIDKLIRDKLSQADWKSHSGESDSFFVNASTWALVFTGKLLKQDEEKQDWWQALKKLMSRSGEPLLRLAVNQAMKILSRQFVMGRDIQEAITRGQSSFEQGFRYSYDMLGEAAITAEDAQRYFEAYAQAIETLGQLSPSDLEIRHKSSVSVKLSALHPRYQEAFAEELKHELADRLLQLAKLAKKYHIGLTVDAEESERLNISLDIFEQVYLSPELAGWDGLGLALQSYHKAAFFVVDWLVELAKQGGRRIMLRLIKGAYWDSEIKKTQMNHLGQYAVFTHKVFTDVSFQACAKKILQHCDYLHPRFATHNAYSVAMILELVGDYRDFEFQCLHGMGRELYDEIVTKDRSGVACRIYAPVGSHEDLLPYLVRRLLENGANSSFVNQVINDQLSIDSLLQDPVLKAKQSLSRIHEYIPLPADIFLPERDNSRGIDWSNRSYLAELQKTLNAKLNQKWQAGPREEEAKPVYAPQNLSHHIGDVSYANAEDVDTALAQTSLGFKTWSKTPVETRAQILLNFADLLEENRSQLMYMACVEAGKTMPDALAEVREAIDFCRYYAAQAKYWQLRPVALQGYTGEKNLWSLHPRGTMICISPWNFPLAIFTGQVVAALVTGNVVIAKPAEQTSLIAAYTTELIYQAGVPRDAMILLPGLGEIVGAALVKDQRIAGVIFTGSTQVARLIHNTLAQRPGPILPLIAETGGINAMIVDSSALLEQVVNDVLVSAFGSAGQRCSALRVLYIQNTVYERFKELLKGALAQWRVGQPAELRTDVGPVIDKDALEMLEAHVAKMKAHYPVLAEAELNEDCKNGYFIAPIAFEIPSISILQQEVFGPILHVIPYEASKLDDVLDEINQTEFGLTMGIQSRIDESIEYIHERVHIGNIYVNRNMIGAVVGLQAFGGEGLSGTGPKAGGPLYLPRLCHERCFTVDTTAAGGNASLMANLKD